MKKFIEKSYRFLTAKHLMIVPFEGNLTQRKKNEIAEKVQNHLNDKFNKSFSLDEVLTATFHPLNGGIEKDLTINESDNLVSISGQGWGSTNRPAENFALLT